MYTTLYVHNTYVHTDYVHTDYVHTTSDKNIEQIFIIMEQVMS